ncbi:MULTISPECIES: BON domain-containing protein [unclassified Cupriavidus]|uniref:BON domain-containing protein n=1 Tax=unclassified Cupriavidus TaxID=2640874 RepID=UPI00295EBCCC|nr:BON domain-containing protein [Cupriavidus sp. TA19]
MFNFRNDRGSRGGNQGQRREGGQPSGMRDENRGSGSEDWGREWGEDWRGEQRNEGRNEGRREGRSEWRGEGQGRYGSESYGNEGRGGESSRHGGPWYQQDTPAGQTRGSWGQPGYGASDAGGTGHPYSSGYGGYSPSAQDSGYRSQERVSGYGYRDEDRFGPRGRGGERDERDSGARDERGERGERGGRAMHWREGMERDRSQRGGEPSYGSGYYGDSGRGGQSFSGGQRVYPDDPGYRRSRAFGQQAATQGQHAGRRVTGPKGYRRSDERVREDVCERLAMNPYIDVGEVSVEVANGVVTLDGTVRERREKYVIEEIADAVFGVTEVDNRLRMGTQGGRGSAWAAGSEVGGEDTGSGTAGSAGISPERTLNKS